MFRFIVLILLSSGCSLLSLPTAAQTIRDSATAPAPHNVEQPAKLDAEGGSQGTAEARVSIARLRVPRKARQLYEKAIAAWEKQNSADAQGKVDQALKIDPAFPEALTLRGFMQATDQRWQSAEGTLRASIRSDPNYYAAYVILAGVYNSQGRYDEAQEAAQQAISAGIHNWTVQYEVARVLIGKGEYENALAITDEALRSKHGSLLHVAKAHALLGLHRYPEAATELRNYLRYEPTGVGAPDAHAILDRMQTLALR